MCMITDRNEFSVADRDIECWKVVKVYWPRVYRTPCIGTTIPRRVIRGKFPFRAEGEESVISSQNGLIVGGGFVHAFTSEAAAQSYARVLVPSVMRRIEIRRCIIQKGTRYAIGYGDHIAAKSIVFAESSVAEQPIHILKKGKYGK